MSKAGQAYDLLARGDLPGALALTETLAAPDQADERALAARAAVLKAAGRTPEALSVNHRATRAFPQSGVAWHNLAATLGDLGRGAEAEAAADRAVGLGLAAPETRLVRARARLTQLKLDEAEADFADAIARRPTYAEAHRELAQLIWMRTGDRSRALVRLEAAAAAYPTEGPLAHALGVALDYAGDPTGARAATKAALARLPGDRLLRSLAVKLACEAGDPAAAVTLARRAGSGPEADVMLAQALLAAGDPAAAAVAAARAREVMPWDQSLLAISATAWRLLGDPRYAAACDYDQQVGVYDLLADPADLSAVRAELEARHRFAAHPFSQSVRQGGQTVLRTDRGESPAIEALLNRFRAAVDAHLAKIVPGADPFTARNTGQAEITGAWSVRLGASGHHTNHVHALGWLSSVFYVALPDETRDAVARRGWLTFGEPGIPTAPPLPPERYIEPRPGRVVLFPSYFWHGTVPIASDQPRLTMAFDALPVQVPA